MAKNRWARSDRPGRAGEGPIQLATGMHILKLRCPDGQPAAIQRICLTNEFGP